MDKNNLFLFMNLFNNLFQIKNIAAKQEDYPAI